ncbi:helicase-associated domain-containing protein [Georgenia sp. MJ173]|uniref:helicase-associated domain-containing protein n=1 Tax=Georgenia sunbinii TaxID=3117728 RepID=UPI002F2659D0
MPAPPTTRPGRRTESVLAALTALDDAGLHAVLHHRPDLAVPPPASLGALAARAASRPSVERALAGLDRHVLDVAEAVCARHPLGPLDPAAVAHDVGADPTAALAALSELLLVVDGVPLQSLLDALGPYPAGLGAPAAGSPAGPAATPAAGPPLDSVSLRDRLRTAPDPARRVLEALRDGPPVGVAGRGAAAAGVQWLLDHGIVEPAGPNQVALPLQTALLLREGRTHPAALPSAPLPAGPTRPAPTVAAESARAAEEMVRLVEQLVQRWALDPAPALRGGGLGVREIGRLATALGLTPQTTATVIELAAAAGLVGDGQDREGTTFLAAAPAAEEWLAADLPHRWAALAAAWLGSGRTPWLVGERDDRGTRLAALGPGLDRSWAARLRRRVVAALAGLPAGLAPDPADLHALLAWSRPRATPDVASTAAVLGEAELLGVLGAGALSSGGRALVDGDTGAVAAALAADLPAQVDEILVQGDLTAVVPGRPSPELARLLALSSDVESRGAGLTVRFTDGSVRRALDAGTTPQDLLSRLGHTSRTPLPQALEYLVTDVGRRHGRLRVGTATSYLRTPDEATTRELLADPRLAPLALHEIAPTVLVSALPAASLLRVLRETGGAPLLEGAGGVVVPGRRDRPPAVRVTPRQQPEVRVTALDDDALARLVGRLRAGAGAPDGADPAHAVALLRDAAASGTAMSVVVAGPSGAVQRRRVRPLSVEGGRARLLDLDRQGELVVAVHRISAVGPAG